MAERRRRAGLKAGRGRGSSGWGPSFGSAAGGPPGPIRPTRLGAPPPRRGRLPWILLVVALIALVPIGYVMYQLGSTLLTVTAPSTNASAGPIGGGTADVHGTVFILLMGSDERHDASGKTIPGQVPHSDTMILVAVDTDNKTARMLSVPRDLLVTIPGYGPDHRVNEAYTLGETQHVAGGGPVLAVKTIQQLTGIQVPYYAVTTFDGFRQTVDAVGGVPINVARPINDHTYPGEHDDYMPIYVPAGLQLMNGERSLEFVRSRHDDPLSDLGRNVRQQQLLNALSRKLLVPGRITQFDQFLAIARQNLRTNLAAAQILGLAQSMIGGGRPQVTQYALDYRYASDYNLGGAAVLKIRPAAQELFRDFANGTPPPANPAS